MKSKKKAAKLPKLDVSLADSYVFCKKARPLGFPEMYGSQNNKSQLIKPINTSFNIAASINSFSSGAAMLSSSVKDVSTAIFDDSHVRDSVSPRSDASEVSHDTQTNHTLFQRSDDESVNRYMTQIGQKDNEKDADVTELSKQFDRLQSESTYSVRYSNLSDWPAESINAKIRSLNLKIAEEIIVRESVLLHLQELMRGLDEAYWKYAAQRIHEAEALHSAQSAELVAKRSRIHIMQKELSVLIAHSRSVSISILRRVHKLRSYYRRELKTDAGISVFWRDENYVLKMLTDLNFLSETQTMHMWLGMKPNPFMVPSPLPSSDLHLAIVRMLESAGHERAQRDEQEVGAAQLQWKKTETYYQTDWLRRHRERVAKEKRGRGRSGGVTMDRKYVLETLKVPQTPTGMNLAASQGSKERAGRGLSMDTIDTESSHSTEQKEGLQEWVQLRDYCWHSWGVNEDTKAMEQGPHVAPQFWNNIEQNPLVVEAAICFQEALPPQDIVPPLSDSMEQMCAHWLQFLREEEKHFTELEEFRRSCHLFRSSIESSMSRIEEVEKQLSQPPLLDEGGSPNRSMIVDRQQKMLKLRQQSSTEQLTGISSVFLSSIHKEHSTAFQASLYEQVAHLARSPTPDRFFLTNSSSVLHAASGLQSPGGFNRSTMSNQHVYGSFINTDQFEVHRIENCPRARQELELKVEESRRMVEYLPGNFSLPSIRPEKVGLREPNRDNGAWFERNATVLQKAVRGYVARALVRRMIATRKWYRALMVIQCAIRGFLAKKRVREKRRLLAISTLFVRKAAMKKYKAALLITEFIRNIVNRKRELIGEPLLRPNNHEKRRIRRMIRKSNQDLRRISIVTANSSPAQTPGLLSRRKSQRLAEDLDSESVSMMSYQSRATTAESRGGSSSLNRANSTLVLPTMHSGPPAHELSTLTAKVAHQQQQANIAAKVLIARVNQDKIQVDTVYNSRLIPYKKQSDGARIDTSKKMLSTRRRVFMNNPSKDDPHSLLADPLDAYIGPIPHKLAPLATSRSAPQLNQTAASPMGSLVMSQASPLESSLSDSIPAMQTLSGKNVNFETLEQIRSEKITRQIKGFLKKYI